MANIGEQIQPLSESHIQALELSLRVEHRWPLNSSFQRNSVVFPDRLRCVFDRGRASVVDLGQEDFLELQWDAGIFHDILDSVDEFWPDAITRDYGHLEFAIFLVIWYNSRYPAIPFPMVEKTTFKYRPSISEERPVWLSLQWRPYVLWATLETDNRTMQKLPDRLPHGGGADRSETASAKLA